MSEDAMTEELKPLPCPFCNSKPEVRHESMGTDYSVVVCPECLARGPESEPEQAAIKAWNTRSPAWRDIESAPTGEDILLGVEPNGKDRLWWRVGVGSYMKAPSGGRILADFPWALQPTHWQKITLPLPPEEGRG